MAFGDVVYKVAGQYIYEGATYGTAYFYGPDGLVHTYQSYQQVSEVWAGATGGTTGGTGGTGGTSYSGGSTSTSNALQIRAIFKQWFGRWPTSAEVSEISKNNWPEATYIVRAVAEGGNGPLLIQAYDIIRQIAAPFYGGDPSAIPTSLVETLTKQGLFQDEAYLRDIYFPKLRGADLTNPLATPYVDAWVEMTGRPMSDAAISQLDQYVRAYGYTGVAEQAWLDWVKTTDSAITGNYGADKRAQISSMITTLFGRTATEEELAAPTATGVASSISMDAEGNVTGPTQTGGESTSLWDLNENALYEHLKATPEYQSVYAGKPDDMSEQEWIASAKAMDAVMRWYYGDNAVVNDDGSITINGDPAATSSSALGQWGIKYMTPETLGSVLAQGYTPEQVQKMFADQEQAVQDAAVYNEILTEAFGEGFTADQWLTFTTGGQGSGELKAKLVEAQNRVGYREAYRRVFGVDPEPIDYERIMSEYVSPGELIDEYQAQFSAEEMYDEVNDMLMRVYGESVSLQELKDMALKRAGSGETSALINQATKLDQYREYHKQYYGVEATPDDYARYAGYVSPAELQWDIVARETADQNRETIKEAWAVAFPDEPMVSDEDIYNMYAGREGYGEMKYKVGEAEEALQKQEQGREWAYTGAERANIGYAAAPGGGFRQSVSGLDEL